MKHEKKLNLLKDDNSPYFMGSSLAMMMYFFLDHLKEIQYDFSSIKKESLKFFEEDVKAFELAKEKTYDYKEYDEIVNIFSFLNKYSCSLYDLSIYFHSEKRKEWKLIFITHQIIQSMIHEDIEMIRKKIESKDQFYKLTDSIFQYKQMQSFISLENSFDKTSSYNNNNRASYIYASIPLIFTLIKLLHRKSNSKKPFSKDFHYRKCINILENGIDNLLTKKTRVKDKELSCFYGKVVSIITDGISEISTSSLKGDYTAIANLIVICDLSINGER